MAPRRSPRRGVVLLLILSLLVLFVLLGMTFLIGAMRYRSGAEAFGQRELLGDQPDKLADLVVHQVIRDSSNPYSSLYGQSLLLDLYGSDATGGVINAAYTAANPSNNDPAMGEIVRFDVQPGPPETALGFNTSLFGPPSIYEDYYAGSVFTMLNGPAARESTRVVRYIPAQYDPMGSLTANARFYVEGFRTSSATIRTFVNANANSNPVQFLVNGKPFNGAGMGYSLMRGGNWTLDQSVDAISPHYGHYLAREQVTWQTPQGEPDEPYDALDYQNMYLARNPPQTGTGVAVVGSFHRPELIRYVANPDTAANWISAGYSWNWDSGDNYRTFRRRFILRPMPWDHPDFTGSNPYFEARRGAGGFVAWNAGADGQPGRAGVDDDGDGAVDNLNIDADGDGTNDFSSESGWPGSDDELLEDDLLVSQLIAAGTTPAGNIRYDVDNDGDGIKDSFWLDLQLPVKTGKNGRLYKPLAALLIVDQDGRLNVNAHGNLAQTQTAYHTGDQTAAGARPYAGPYSIIDPNTMSQVTAYGEVSILERRDNNGDGSVLSPSDSPNANDWPAHGQGYGPAAISFQHLVTDGGNVDNRSDIARYESILLSRYTSRWDSADMMPGSAGADFLAFLKSVGRPDYFAVAPTMGNPTPYGSWANPSAFSSPPDMFDRGTVALSPGGQPIWRYAGATTTLTTSVGSDAASEKENHPYEMNLLQPTADDSPFTPAELERVLRYNDADAGVLSRRLFDLLDGADTPMPQLSKLLTTHSSYVPSLPTVPLPPDNGVTDAQLFDILFPTDYVLPLPAPNMGTPQQNPLMNNAARIAIRNIDVDPSHSPGTYGTAIAMTGAPRMPTIIDLFAAKIVQGHLVAATSNTATDIPNSVNGIPNLPAGRDQLRLHLSKVVPFEFRRGQKMDPNRLWGNGEDDNSPNADMVPGNITVNSVDEQYYDDGTGAIRWDMDGGELIWPGTSHEGAGNYLNDDPIGTTFGGHTWHPRGREIFARHLYCLMMLLVDLDRVPAGGTFGAPQSNPTEPMYMEPYSDDPGNPMFTGPTAEVMRRELTIRRIAQWAINAVDFRDADGIMTPFEYDVNPWNYNQDPANAAQYDPSRCWALDGRIDTDDFGTDQTDGLTATIPPPAEAHPERRVVWGAEHPDLLITETMALHDRRVKDTALDDGDGTKRDEEDDDDRDNDLDQFRLPQGSLFIELYCPKRNVYSNTSGPVDDYQVAPQELYNVTASSVQLRLAQMAPGSPGYPVWRLAISETHRGNADLYGPLELMTAGRHDNISFQPYSSAQPDEMYVVQPSAVDQVPRLPIERIVWFAQQSPDAYPVFEQNRVYYNRYGATTLNAGEYLVIGPRAITHVGSQDSDPPADLETTIDVPSDQEFRLLNPNNGDNVFYYTDFGYPRRYPTDTTNLGGGNSGAQVKTARTMIVAANPPTNWGPPAGLQDPNETANVVAGVTGVGPIPGVGLSVSEPLRNDYYDEPQYYLEGDMATADYPLRDSWRSVAADGADGELPDQPFDTDPNENFPLRVDNVAATGRYGDYKTVFLQRLANPLLPWHPTVNPYLTVDWHPIDLTVFNGEDHEPDGFDEGAFGAWDPSDPDERNTSADRATDSPPFASRERVGQQRDSSDNTTDNVNYGLWRTSFLAHQRAETEPRSGDYFKLNARHSLGYLSRLIDGTSFPDHPNPTVAGASDGDDFVLHPSHASVVGDPSLPFPWLTWNDRPYVSHLELMYVPSSSPGRLLFEYLHRGQAGSADTDPYAPHNLGDPPSSVTRGAAPYTSYRSPYGHLLNFFQTTSKTAASGDLTQGANYYRLLDFVEVPSRFAGAEKWFNPDQIRNANAAANDVEHYRPPFNYLSRFRDPGRVNLNTIWDYRVWRGVSSGFPLLASSSSWTTIDNTMRANAATSTDDAADYPTYYPNPFRPSGAALYAPPLVAGASDADLFRLREDPVDATLLRSSDTAAAPGTVRNPLLDHPNFAVFNPPRETVAAHPRPNPYFRYQGLQRLGNLVSGQSNVFAVWVTIGYFEVTRSPAGVDREHPDGFLLGQEVGADTGEIVRHRAFYLIDRSAPVAFQPGVNHNIEETILLRRMIE